MLGTLAVVFILVQSTNYKIYEDADSLLLLLTEALLQKMQRFKMEPLV